MAEIFGRVLRLTVDGVAVEKLRIGFTIERTLLKEPNRCEIAIYNLASGTRERFHRLEEVPVVLEAGFEDTGMPLLFSGYMRKAFSRPEGKGTWVTILRAADGDKAIRKKRHKKTAGIRPGVSLERVISDQAKALGVGMGNVGAEIAKGNFNYEVLGRAFANGFNGDGSVFDQLDKMMRAGGRELSIQDGELQVLEIAKALAENATFLSRDTGLEGSPEVDEHGVMSCRARILPGLNPGYPVQTQSVTSYGSGLWRIDKVRYVGDTHGKDWNAELGKCLAITSG